MANTIYPLGRQAFLDGDIDWTAHTIKVQLVDADYTYSASHQFYSSVAAAGRVGAAQTLASKTVTNGVADAADVVFPSISNATAVVGLVIYRDTGVEGTSPLIAYIDTATGLPVTPNGGNITVAWDNGTNKIFTL